MSAEASAVYVEAETAQILRELQDAEPVDRSTLTAEEARAQMAASSEVWNQPLPDMAEARDFAIDGPAGPIPARILR
ncbi:MAG: hypothetical protein OEU92_16730, partial [Alphaproteobacteria bacterium]|nr:hypothetical protein [Alphaproteobacteria bacterium]